MLSRKEQNDQPIYLPDDWKKKVTELLSQVYKAQLTGAHKVFDIYGLTYPDEVVLIVSLLSQTDGAEAPVSFIMSADLTKDKKSDVMLDALIDSVGIFFDNYFQTPDWSDYQAKWEDADFNGTKFFYIVSRENFGLTIAANKLLEDM
jgi:hypothetical protein